MPDRASSAVVVLRAIVSWTWVLTRSRGRPKTTAMTSSAGASSSTMNSSDGLSVNRMMIEPTRPMTDDSSWVTVWVSIVRTIVTSFDRREMSSPTRWPAWKSSDRVTSRPNSSPRSWATTRSPTTPSRYVWRNEPTAWTQNSRNSTTMSRSRPVGSPPTTTWPVIPAMTSGNRSPSAGREHEGDDGDREREPVRTEVAEQAAPRHAAEAADLADDGSGVGRDAGELGAHVSSLMARRVTGDCGADVETAMEVSACHPADDVRRQALLPVTTRRTGPERSGSASSAGPAGRGRAFDGDPELVGQLGLGRADRVVRDGDHRVDPAGQERDGRRDGDARRDAVRVGVGGVGVDRPPGLPRAGHRVGAGRLDADDPDVRRGMPQPRRHPDEERAVADRDDGRGRRSEGRPPRPRR